MCEDKKCSNNCVSCSFPIPKVVDGLKIVYSQIDMKYVEALEARIVELTKERDEITKRRAEASNKLEEWRVQAQRYEMVLTEIHHLVNEFYVHRISENNFIKKVKDLLSRGFED